MHLICVLVGYLSRTLGVAFAYNQFHDSNLEDFIK